MVVNPLQQYFRQPKIYIKLPSRGIFNRPGSITGDVANMPVYGMTGMDEIVMKTPDSLLTGESVVQVIRSCVPGISEPWDLSVLDTDLVFAAIRIATYGNEMSVVHSCPKCQTENQYDVDLTKIIEHFSSRQYDNKIVLKDLVIKTQPLNYKQSTEFAMKNFALQQRLSQSEKVEDKEEQQKLINQIFLDLALIQNDLYYSSIESVEVGNTVVNERSFIKEWIDNCDKAVFDQIKQQIEKNKAEWLSPMYDVKCEECSSENKFRVELDQSNFFA